MRRAATAALLLALTACSAGTSASPQTEGPAPTANEGFANAPVVPAGDGTDDLEACRTRRLDIRVARQEDTKDGLVSAVLILTNTGVTTCALTGWPTVELQDNGKRVILPDAQVAEPTSAVDIALRAGSSAFAALRWTPCAPDSAGCGTGSRLMIGTPGSDLVAAELSDFSLAERRLLAIRSIVIGSLQPTREGLTNW